MNDPMEAMDYVDGYHGGHYYNVPVGSWRDLAQAVEAHVDWPLVFDLEPDSWAHCWEEDPGSYARLRPFFDGEMPRFELVNNAYGHPYGWITDGEWLIHHGLEGQKILDAALGPIQQLTWAPQEPMWCSAMPGILLELGYQQSVLKDPGTAFAGYTQGYDHDLIQWVGADGRSLPAVPRYACEGLVRTWETESRYATREFARRCREQGIQNPVGSGLQDIGWVARPAQPFKQPEGNADHVTYHTWQRYFEKTKHCERPEIRLEIKDFKLAFPWGDHALDRVALATRQSEWAWRQAMGLSIFAWLSVGYDIEKKILNKALQGVLKCQHHDNWICARWREGEENFARRTEILRDVVQSQTDEVIFEVRRALYQRYEAGSYVHALNISGHVETTMITLDVPVDHPDVEIHLIDGDDEVVPVQIHRERVDSHYHHFVNNHQVTVIAEVKLPAFGIGSFEVKQGLAESISSSVLKVETLDQGGQEVRVSGDKLGEITFDARRGGTPLRWLTCEGVKHEWGEGPGLGTVCGMVGGGWCSSEHVEAELEILEQGPLRVRIQSSFMMKGLKVIQQWMMSSSSGLLECEVNFAPAHTSVVLGSYQGEQDSRNMIEIHDHFAWFDTLNKLQMLSGMKDEGLVVDREGPFDVGRDSLHREDEKRGSWQGIENHTCVRWADFRDENNGKGMAMFTDRHTEIVHARDRMSGLVLAWAGEAFPLDQQMTRRMAFCPHAGDWMEAGLWNKARAWEQGLHRETWIGPKLEQANQSLIHLNDAAIELLGAYEVEDDLVIRIYNSSEVIRNVDIEIAGVWGEVILTDVRLGSVQKIDHEQVAGMTRVSLKDIQGHGFRTLRCSR